MIPTTIKPFLLLLILLCSLSSNAQSIVIKLKAEVLKSETEEAIKTGREPTDLQFASFQYSLIPIKEWWRLHYIVFNEFRTQMRLLTDETYAQLRKQDLLRGTHQADSLAASVRQEELSKAVEISKEESYFKAKYQNADPAQQVYQVLYQLKYKQSGQEVQNRMIRKAFNPSDLSEIHSFK